MYTYLLQNMWNDELAYTSAPRKSSGLNRGGSSSLGEPTQNSKRSDTERLLSTKTDTKRYPWNEIQKCSGRTIRAPTSEKVPCPTRPSVPPAVRVYLSIRSLPAVTAHREDAHDLRLEATHT